MLRMLQNDREREFLGGLVHGAFSAGIIGVIGAAAVGGIVTLFSGPVIPAAAVAGGVFGLLGTALSSLDSATSGARDSGAPWLTGITVAAALAFGIPKMGFGEPSQDNTSQEPSSGITDKFNCPYPPEQQSAKPVVSVKNGNNGMRFDCK
ncbi:MAG: hypothetical protein OXT65_08180 [Alphaproteobacteria bacterium]|nr:hypothetical protein [Alphaproteobacteria bacterium]